jgi:hypothetical protein
MVAQCLLLELTGTIVDVQSQNIDKMYRQEKYFNSTGNVAQKMRKTLNYLARTFEELTPEFKGRAQFVSLYWLVSQTIDRYVMTGRESDLKKFFIDIEIRRKDENDIEMIRYTEALSRSSDGRERIEYRHQILIREWLLFTKNLETKDSQRVFTEDQRIAIYRRDDGICQICGEKILNYDQEFEADHKIAFSQGGKTTVENGQATHKSCNRVKGASVRA